MTESKYPSLVQLCQRVATTHVDSIDSLGPEFRYDLVKPILERCTDRQLLRLDNVSPHLQPHTEEIWKRLCHIKFPTVMERLFIAGDPEPQSWREHYFVLEESEARRLEEISSKLRNHRMEADELKKRREVKLTDKLPPPKRQRGSWGGFTGPTPQRTLFQKTRADANRLQKNVFRPPGSTLRPASVLKQPDPIFLPPLPSMSSLNRVTVRTVIQSKKPPPIPSVASSSIPSSSASSFTSLSPRKPDTTHTCQPLPIASSSSAMSASLRALHSPSSTAQSLILAEQADKTDTATVKRKPVKKDPMASLFVPKVQRRTKA